MYLRSEKASESDKYTARGSTILKNVMSEIEAMCESVRLMPDIQSREIEENRDMKMAAMFGHGTGQW